MFIRRLIRNLIEGFCRRIYPYIIHIKNDANRDFIQRLKCAGRDISVGEGIMIFGETSISIGNDCHFGKNCRIEAIHRYKNEFFYPELIIHDYVSMEDFCHVGCINKVEIGEGTMIASRVFITDHFHGTISSADLSLRPALRPLSSKPVNIGRNVWIGEGVSIMPGVSLGDNVIVGANAVVTHSFGPNVVIAGCPAKVIRVLGV